MRNCEYTYEYKEVEQRREGNHDWIRYVGAADWGGKDPAKCNRGFYRLSTDTGDWATLDGGLPENVEVRCVTLHPDDPGVVIAGTQDGPYRSKDAGDTWERLNFPQDEPVVWSFMVRPRRSVTSVYRPTIPQSIVAAYELWQTLLTSGSCLCSFALVNPDVLCDRRRCR